MTPPQDDRISGLDILRTENLVFLEELIEAGKIKPSKDYVSWHFQSVCEKNDI